MVKILLIILSILSTETFCADNLSEFFNTLQEPLRLALYYKRQNRWRFISCIEPGKKIVLEDVQHNICGVTVVNKTVVDKTDNTTLLEDQSFNPKDINIISLSRDGELLVGHSHENIKKKGFNGPIR